MLAISRIRKLLSTWRSMHASHSPAVLRQYCSSRAQYPAAALHASNGRCSSRKLNYDGLTSVGSLSNTRPQPLAQHPDETFEQVITGTVSLYVISDLHTDYAANLKWVKQLDKSSRAGSSTGGSSSSSGGRGSADVSVLIVAGDISDDIRVIRSTLECLTEKFTLVAFVPGNHELWVKGSSKEERAARNAGAEDSIQKLHKVLQLCEELGVATQPALLGVLLLVPLLAWHHQSWDREADIPAIPRASALTIADYAACKWPMDFPGAHEAGAAATAAWFDAVNESDMQQPGWGIMHQLLLNGTGSSSSSSRNDNRRNDGDKCSSSSSSSTCIHEGGGSSSNSGSGGDCSCSSSEGPAGSSSSSSSSSKGPAGSSSSSSEGPAGSSSLPHIVSFSHFLPHQSLLPEKRFLAYPNLAKAVGSDYLWARLQQLQPHVHAFGHSHFAWDQALQGIRCIQAPLCYPAEREHRLKSVILHNAASDSLQAPGSSSGGGGDAGGSSSSSRHQPHPLHVGLRDHHERHVEWLPVRVYEAKYTAEFQTLDCTSAEVQTLDRQQRQQQGEPSSSSSSSSSSLRETTYTSESQSLDVQQQQQQQQQHKPSSSGSSSTSTSNRSIFKLLYKGLPILHPSHLPILQQQQQQDTIPQQQQQQQRDSTAQQQQQQVCTAQQQQQQQQQAHHTAQQQQQQQCYILTSWQGTWCGNLGGLWSDYYKTNARQPDNTQLAPWVAKRYQKYKRWSVRPKDGRASSSSSSEGNSAGSSSSSDE